MSELDRETLFSNEAFVIGVLQAVSGGSIVAALSQVDTIINRAGETSFLLFLTLMVLCLILSVVSAYFKHQYKVWDVKQKASESRKNIEEAKFRAGLTGNYLIWMRRFIAGSVIIFVVGMFLLVGSFWFNAFCPASAPNNQPQPTGFAAG